MKARIRLLRNLVGPQVRRFRCRRNWSQEDLVSKLQDAGWNISRPRLARIEGREACVTDIECVVLASTLGVKTQDLLPQMDSSQSLFVTLSAMTGGQLKRLMPPEDILADRTARLLNESKILSRNLDKAGARRPQISA